MLQENWLHNDSGNYESDQNQERELAVCVCFPYCCMLFWLVVCFCTEVVRCSRDSPKPHKRAVHSCGGK